MKKLIFLITLFTILLACEKQEPEEKPITTGTVTFWTTEPSFWKLIVDHNSIGIIGQPYPINRTDQIPVCGDDRFTKLSLSEGRHHYYMIAFLPQQPPPNYFVGQTYYFDVVAGECTVIRATQ